MTPTFPPPKGGLRREGVGTEGRRRVARENGKGRLEGGREAQGEEGG